MSTEHIDRQTNHEDTIGIPFPLPEAGVPAQGTHSTTTDRRRRRRIIAVVALVGILAAVLFTRIQGGLTPAPTTAAAAVEPDGPALDDTIEDQVGTADDGAGLPEWQNPQEPSGTDGTDGSDGDDGVDIPPVDQPPAQPCDGFSTAAGLLKIHADPVVLADNVKNGTVAVTNCGADAIDWGASTNPKVTLATSGDTLEPGATADLGFGIDFDAYGDGAITFKIKVTEPDHSHYVDVHAYNPLLGSESVVGGGLSAGDGVGGCATQCITKAILRPNATTPNVALDVATNTAAYLSVFISKDAPVVGPNGPVFAGVAAIDHTDGLVTTWTAQLKPLQADTTYYLIVRAIDADGDRAFRHGSFHTRTPVQGPGGLAQPGGPSGCATQCITKALVTPGPDGTTAKLAVTSHTAARFQASVSREAPSYPGGVPTFADTDGWANSGLEASLTSWTTTFTGLTAATEYHIVIKAEDAQGRRSYRAGRFTTAAGPTKDVDFALVSVRIDRDGDKVGRGEVSLGWRVGDTTVATFSEKKRADGDLVTFGSFPWSYVVTDATGWLPVVRVAAYERDADGLIEFCTIGPDIQQDPGSNGSCDLKWNIASSGLVSVTSVDDLPACETFPTGDRFPGYRCLELASAPNGSDYPSITAVVALRTS